MKNYPLVVVCLFIVVLSTTRCGMDPSEPGNLVPGTVADNHSLPRADINGTTLHLMNMGQGSSTRVAILLHGGPGFDSRSLLPVSDMISDAYNIIIYDQRGSGLSKRLNDSTLSVAGHVEDLESIRVAYASTATELVLIGHSWGGGLIQAYLAKYADVFNSIPIHRIIFLGTMPQNSTILNRVANNDAPGLFGREFAEFLVQRNMIGESSHAELDFRAGNALSLLPFYFCDPDEDVRKLPLWRVGWVALVKTQENGLLAGKFQAGATAKYDFSSGNAAFTGSVLALGGACDKHLGISIAIKTLGSFTAAASTSVYEISGSGHWMWLDNPSDTRMRIRVFLGLP